ncbi:MAG: hypothetical protein HYT65_00885, partial [Candidatus Yanofskybacteria bacterium]|nr:hypothetical protein [Candidatus Yanofskybacteria bacterium]
MNNHIFRAGIAGALLFSFPLGALASPIVWVLSFQNNLTIPGVISTVDVNNSYAVSNIILNIDGPQSVAFSSDQTKAYIAYRDSSKVEAVDTATYAILS